MSDNQLHIEIGERLTELVDQYANGISRQFAFKINMDTSQFSKMQKGNKGLTVENAVEISSMFNISMNWLLLGEGEKYINEKSGTDKAPDPKLLTQIEDHANGILLSLEMLRKKPLVVPGKETTAHPRGYVQRANTLDKTKTDKRPKGK